MMRNVGLRTGLVGAITTALAMVAVASPLAETPYQKILERNLFDLKPPPPPPPPPEPPKPPAPPISLNGITIIFGKKRALLKVGPAKTPPQPPQPGKAPEPAKEQSYILGEGERQDEVEVLAIDDKANIVTVNNHGTITNLTFEIPKVAAAPTPAPPGAPMLPRPPGPVPAPPQPTIVMPPSAGVTPTVPPTATAPPAAASSAIAMPGASEASVSAGAGVTTLRTIPTRPLRAGTVGVTQPGTLPVGSTPPATVQSGTFKPFPPEKEMSLEEQIILIEAQRELHKNDPNYPPLPPTPLNPNP